MSDSSTAAGERPGMRPRNLAQAAGNLFAWFLLSSIGVVAVVGLFVACVACLVAAAVVAGLGLPILLGAMAMGLLDDDEEGEKKVMNAVVTDTINPAFSTGPEIKISG